jgi:hypothetical protein
MESARDQVKKANPNAELLEPSELYDNSIVGVIFIPQWQTCAAYDSGDLIDAVVDEIENALDRDDDADPTELAENRFDNEILGGTYGDFPPVFVNLHWWRTIGMDRERLVDHNPDLVFLPPDYDMAIVCEAQIPQKKNRVVYDLDHMGSIFTYGMDIEKDAFDALEDLLRDIPEDQAPVFLHELED